MSPMMRGIPVPITATELVSEVETSVLDTLRADPYVRVDGMQGVKVIELHYPQPGGDEFAQRRAGTFEKPLLSVVVNHARGDNSRASNIRAIFLDIVVLAQAEQASTRAGRTKAAEIVGQAIASLVHNIDEKTHTWLASSHPVLIENRDHEIENADQDTRDSYTHRARGLITVEVRVPDVLS